ncbi:hypothetical protein KGQ20_02270 [Catenulispora sp. NF23]|uniref:Asparagine synthetase domain-containing protein n=1 Tax=Catenulispora pinistramenti TaxID=2705254 RepID=A0ABS5KIE2_9ACTN|nr:asparagine synthase-related protein [Catenulispora pinistramenti]MBS2531591.1 hypothetical protein [Catenulispora pinistramenti]MBS2546159.1 hypothetical protein [Catenulispora pinistramenti]
MGSGTVLANRLALWLSWPAIIGEFAPCPLLGAPPAPSPASSRPDDTRPVADIRGPFSESVRDCMGDHERIGISVSGGLDSLAVLIEAARIADQDGRRIVAVMAEMTDDAGLSNVPVVRRLLAASGLGNIELHITAARDTPTSEPDWHPEGPNLAALPSVKRSLLEKAADHGATVAIGGSGADELLGTVRYMFGIFTAAGDWRALRSYWSDTIGKDRQAIPGEGLALATRLLPRAWRSHLYFATEWPELSVQKVPEIVSAAHHDQVASWSAQWITRVLKHHATRHQTWAQMAAWDAVFPLYLPPGPGPMPLKHPFLTPNFVAAAQRLPLARRYDPTLPHAYWRQKAAVISLIPKTMRSILPTAKQTFRNDLASRYMAGKSDAANLIACGVIDEKAWMATSDPSLVNRVNALESWIREADHRGYSIRS